MPVLQASLLGCGVMLMVLLTRQDRLHPFIALVLVATAFGLTAGSPFGPVSSSFGLGFSQVVAAVGLVIVAAMLIASIAERSGAASALAAKLQAWPAAARVGLLSAIGVLGGLGGALTAAYVVVTPLRQAIDPPPPAAAGHGALRLGLAMAASHGLLWPSPAVIAAAAILHAEIGRVVLMGLPAALAALAAGQWLAGWTGAKGAATLTATASAAAPAAGAGRTGIARGFALPVVTLLLLALLIVQSIGTLPSEPLGGGSIREGLLGAGRPLTLLVVGVTAMVLLTGGAAGRWWHGEVAAGPTLARAGGLLLVIGAAGGLQTLTQQTGMAELLAERLLDWRVGLALPFCAALVMKLLQGSTSVAVITAAGMIEPLLPALGLDNGQGRALATLALGAGAAAGSQVNDPLFWLVADAARLGTGRALALVTGGTLLQGAAALAVLQALRALL